MQVFHLTPTDSKSGGRQEQGPGLVDWSMLAWMLLAHPPSFFSLFNRSIMPTTTEKAATASAPNTVTVDEILLGIRSDLYVANHALQFESEMPEHERGEVHFSIQRIIARMDDLRDRAMDQLEKIPYA